jgi:hypothetical protein
VPEGGGQTGSAPRAAAAGGVVALVAVLGILEGQLGTLNLRREVLALATVLIALLVLLQSTIAAQRARRDAKAGLSETLDAALACWPPRAADALSPYDVGVHPRLAPGGAPSGSPPDAYDARPELDAALRQALMDERVIVVFGAPGSGKTRAAFEAVRTREPPPKLLVPENADGLRAMLRLTGQMDIEDSDVVVWLDDLDRYATGLDGDVLARFLERTPRRRWRHRLRRPPVPQTHVVATIRDDALQEILAPTAGGDPVLRRLVAQARGVAVPDFTNAAAATDAAGWRQGWDPAVRPAAPPAPRRTPRHWARDTIDGPLLVAGVTAAVAVTLPILILWEGATRPRSTADQVASVIAHETCTAFASPAKGSGLVNKTPRSETTANTLVVVVQGAQCGRSDVVQFYRLRNDRLRLVATLGPPSTGRRLAFHCLGPPGQPDPCHVRVQGTTTYVVGAFASPTSQLELPVAVSFDDGLRAWALALPPAAARAAPRLSRHGAAQVVRLNLQVDGRPPASGRRCTTLRMCVHGRRATVTAIVPPAGGMPAALVAGYSAKGTIEAPTTERLQMWALAARPDGTPEVDRDCVVLHEGRVLRRTIRGTADAAGLQKLWSAKSPLMC